MASSVLHCGDCLEVMPEIPAGSVDMVLCDLPYGTTACKWDSVIPFEPLWAEYWRVATGLAAIVLTASQPFTTALVASQIEHFKYEWIWEKPMASGFAHAKNRPLKAHENILVFSRGVTVHASQSSQRMCYNPQMSSGAPYQKTKKRQNTESSMGERPSHPQLIEQKSEGTRYPRSVVNISNPNGGSVHPTQKPVALMEYLIKTYTNEGDTVLDNCMGSGTTGVACMRTGRNFIGIERDETYFKIAQERINSAVPPLI
jgi:site-specific DNA-methyltransferase (adenine-specific)